MDLNSQEKERYEDSLRVMRNWFAEDNFRRTIIRVHDTGVVLCSVSSFSYKIGVVCDNSLAHYARGDVVLYNEQTPDASLVRIERPMTQGERALQEDDRSLLRTTCVTLNVPKSSIHDITDLFR